MPDLSRTLPVTPTAAWAALADIAAWPSWLPTVTSTTHVAGTPVSGVGASYAVVQPRLRKAVWTVTSWTEGSGFVWESRLPGVRTTGSHTVEPAEGGGTIVELGISWAGPIAGLVRAAYGRLTREYIKTEAAALGDRAASLA
jgi:hypothetical protein